MVWSSACSAPSAVEGIELGLRLRSLFFSSAVSKKGRAQYLKVLFSCVHISPQLYDATKGG